MPQSRSSAEKTVTGHQYDAAKTSGSHMGPQRWPTPGATSGLTPVLSPHAQPDRDTGIRRLFPLGPSAQNILSVPHTSCFFLAFFLFSFFSLFCAVFYASFYVH
jgi:hypothetical protein